ncbi:MAG: hypothetical protein AB1758_02705, partial [Candidatus Eremiobacterota bacterium]
MVGTRGAALGAVLMAAAVGLVLTFGLLGLSLHHLNAAQFLSNQQTARNHAESTVQMAIHEILVNPDYGSSGQPGSLPQDEIRWSSPGVPGFGVLTFNDAHADELGVAPSTNNLAGDAPRDGWGRAVPACAVQLVGTGTCNGVTHRVEVFLHLPPFPFVVGSSGPIRTDGSCLIGKLPQGVVPSAGGISKDGLLPGDLGSNSLAPEALVLGPQTRVTGNAQAVGGVVLEPGAVVEGEVRSGADRASLPTLDITSYDPRVQEQPDIQGLSGAVSGPSLSGPAVAEGGLSVDGGLTLDEGWLYVDGDLEVNGGIQGKGAVFVTGTTTVNGQVTLQADNQVALLSVGDVELHGQGKQSSYFRGQVYTGGDFTADELTVVGTFVANSPDPEGSTMRVRNADLLQESAPLKMSVRRGSASQGQVAQSQGYNLPFGPNPLGWGSLQNPFQYAPSRGYLTSADGPNIYDTAGQPTTAAILELVATDNLYQGRRYTAGGWILDPAALGP